MGNAVDCASRPGHANFWIFSDSAKPARRKGVGSSGSNECFVSGARREGPDYPGWNFLELNWLRLSLRKRQFQLHTALGCGLHALLNVGHQRELSIQREVDRNRLRGQRLLASGKREQCAELGRTGGIQSDLAYNCERDVPDWTSSVQYGT